MTIGEYVFEFVVNTLIGGSYANEWLTANLDKIQGICTVVGVSIVYAIASALVWGIWRALQKVFHFWE